MKVCVHGLLDDYIPENVDFPRAKVFIISAALCLSAVGQQRNNSTLVQLQLRALELACNETSEYKQERLQQIRL